MVQSIVQQEMKHQLTTLALACLACTVPALTQAQANAGAAQKNIEQSIQVLRDRTPKPLANVDMLGLETDAQIDKLMSVDSRGTLLAQDIEAYWRPFVGSAVTKEDIQSFHAWFYEKARQEGFMAYARTEVVASGAGQRLLIQTLQPRVGAIRILSKDPALTQKYASLLQKRFETDFRPGMPLDTLGLDQRLDSACFDLPIELDATLRAVGPELLDLIVNITAVTPKGGDRLSSLVQLNNHGLKQYGQAQLLGVLSVGGLAEKSALSLTAQKSQGIGYLRGDYESLAPWLGSRWRVWGSRSDSHSIQTGSANTNNLGVEAGAGLTRVLGGSRDMVYKAAFELSTRQSQSNLTATGTEISRTNDQQLRLRVTADNERLASHATRAELGLTAGNYSRVIGTTLPEGSYTRLDVSAKTQKALGHSRAWTMVAKVKGQWASRNLDAYNQVVLGGVSGVRAYTSVDGVGDRGVVGTLELNRAFEGQWSAGVFYDGGYVQNSVKRSATQAFNHDALQAVGLQLQGQYQRLNYNLIWAQGVGGYKSWQGINIESKPNNQRLTASVSYAF
jgi:hemolysin activation/secretion protein